MSLLFKFSFQNIFSELKHIIIINYKGLAEASMFRSRFEWLMISPDRQSIFWWKPGKTNHGIQNKLRCCMFTMLLLSNLIITKNVKRFFVHASFQGFIITFLEAPLYSSCDFIFCLLIYYVFLKALTVHVSCIQNNSSFVFFCSKLLSNQQREVRK